MSRSRGFKGAVFVQVLSTLEEVNVSVKGGVQGKPSPRGQVLFGGSEHQAASGAPIPSDSLPPSPSLHELRHSLWWDCCSMEMSVSLERQTRGSRVSPVLAVTVTH